LTRQIVWRLAFGIWPTWHVSQGGRQVDVLGRHRQTGRRKGSVDQMNESCRLVDYSTRNPAPKRE
jgi:hypothetical protein